MKVLTIMIDFVKTHFLVLESRDDKLKPVLVGSPRVGGVLQGDKVGERRDDAVVAEARCRLLAREVGLRKHFYYHTCATCPNSRIYLNGDASN